MRSKIKSVFQKIIFPLYQRGLGGFYKIASFLKTKKIFSGKFSLMFLAVTIVITIGASVPVYQAQAGFLGDVFDIGGSIANWVKDGAMTTIYSITVCLLSLVLDVVSWGVNVAAFFIDVMLQPVLYTGDSVTGTPGVLTSSAINIGWTAVRDVCNTFFIFFLLLIAFAMILRIQKFGSTKTLLVKFIMAIFLINFSMVIAKIIIDIGQVFMYEIVTWMPSGFQGKAEGLTTVVDGFKNEINWGVHELDSVVKALFAVIYSMMLMLIYFMLAIFLLIRLVMFAILIILSPFAFLSLVLPSMSKYTNEWFDTLIKYTLFGPIFLFFIFLSATMANELMNHDYMYPSAPSSIDESFANMLVLMIPHAVALCMLYAVIPVTQKLGGAASQRFIGGTMGLGKIAIGGYAGMKIAGGLGKKSAAWSGRRAGVDSRGIKKLGYGAVEKGANKLGNSKLGKLGAVKRTTDTVKGRIVIENAKQATKDKEAISKKQAKLTTLGEKDLKALTVGNISKGKGLLTRKAKEETNIDTAAAFQEYVKKGGDGEELMETNPGAAARLASINIDLDELAKSNPGAAAKIKSMKDGGDEKKYKQEYFEKHAEDGDWKKYNDSTWDNYAGDIVKAVDDDEQIQRFRNTAGKKKRKVVDNGVNKWAEKSGDTSKWIDSHGNKRGPHAPEEIKKIEKESVKAKQSADIITGDLVATHGEKKPDKDSGEMRAVRTDKEGTIKVIDTVGLEKSIDEMGKNFKNLSKESKELFGQKTKGVGGIDFKGEKLDNLEALIYGLSLNTLAVKQEAMSNNILSQRIRTLRLSDPKIDVRFPEQKK